MFRAKSSALLIIAAALAAGAGFFTQRHVNGAGSPSSRILGQPRIDFTMKDTEGHDRRLSEWDGKVLIVNFWATWCPPCRKEIPDFIKLQAQYGGQGVQFVGIAVDNLDDVRKFVKSEGINYPILVGDEDGAVAHRYGNNVDAIPYTVVIDRKGRVITTRSGLFHHSEAEATIRDLL